MPTSGPDWRIPQYLDEPWRFLFFRAHDFMILGGAYLGGALTNSLGITLPASRGAVILLREADKRLRNRFDLIALIYWFTPLSFTGVPESWKREFRG